MSTDPAFDFHYDTERERLHWTIEAGGGEHILDLIPGVLGSVAVLVDGRTVAHLPKPKPRRSWRELQIEIGHEPVDIVLISNRPVMYTDVFVGGRSVRDRRTIDQARAAAPEPASLYEATIGGYDWYQRPRRLPIVDRWVAIPAIVSLVALAVVLIWAVRPMGLIAAGVVLIAMLTLVRVWFATFHAVLSRVHLALLDRPELGEERRVAWFVAAMLGYPVVSVALVVLVYGVARTLASR